MRAFTAELSQSVRTLRFVGIAFVIVLLPTLYGLAIRDAYALTDAADLFTLMLSNLVPLMFPLLVSLTYQPRLLDEWSNSFPRLTRTRIDVRGYLATRAGVAATLASTVFAVMILVAWLSAHSLFGDAGFAQASPVAVSDRFTFSQVHAISPVLFVLCYSGWVGLNAGAYAVFSTALSAVAGNRFLALAAPLVLYFLGGFALAVLGLEEISPSSSIFPFNITQQPMLFAVVPLMFVLVTSAALFALVHRRNYATAGLDRV